MRRATTTNELKPKSYYNVAVVFDICSSSRIIGGLSQTNQHNWAEVLLKLERVLVQFENQSEKRILRYKFVGDGWILLARVNGQEDTSLLIRMFERLYKRYGQLHTEYIEPFLDNPIHLQGLSFGVNSGEMYSFDLRSGETEYVGAPINIATRLQGAIANPNDKSDSHSNQLIMTNGDYSGLFSKVIERTGWKTSRGLERTLRNIKNDAPFLCTRIWLDSADQ